MAQENGWPFKLVYLEWAETSSGEKVPLGNGLPLPFIEIAKKEFKLQQHRHYGMPPDASEKYHMENSPHAHSATSLPRTAHRLSLDYGQTFEVSLDEIQDDNNLYLLPVEVTGGVGANVLTSKHHVVIDGKSYSYNFFDDSIATFPKIIELLQLGKVKFLYNSLHDPLSTGALAHLQQLEEKLHNVYKIPYENIIIFSGSKVPANTLKCKFFYDEGMYYANMMGGQILAAENGAMSSGGIYKSEIFQVKDLDSNHVRALKFLSPNNNMVCRMNRTFMLHWAIKHNLLDCGLFSFLQKPPDDAWIRSHIIPHYPISDEELKTMFELLPYEGLDTTKYTKEQLNHVIYGPGQVKSWYEQTYISLVDETSSNTYMPFVSEKSYRPMANLHPFIILGPGGILKTLRALGFRTFAGFIDESYDDIDDDLERFKHIEKEIVRFKNMTQQEMHDWYYSLTDILIHNQSHLKSFITKDPYHPIFDQIYEYYFSK